MSTCPANQRRQKNAYSTSRLGVSRFYALSTLRERLNLACMLKLRAPVLHLFMLRVCTWLCTEGYMPSQQGLYKRWVAEGPGNHALWVKLPKMFDVPRVAHWDSIFGFQADCTGPGDSYYPIRAFPLRRQLVRILGRLNTPKNKVAFLKASGIKLAAMVAAQGLLVARCSHSRLKTIFLEERCVILPQTLLLKARHKRALEVTRI